MRTTSRFPTASFDVGRQPARADAHAGLAAVHRRVVPRRRHRRDRRLSRRLASVAALAVGGAAACARRRARNAKPYRVFSRARDSAARSSRTASAISSHAPPVRAADRAAQGARVARGSRERLEGCWPASGLLEPVRVAGHARGRTVRVLVTGATGFTGGHLARALAGAGPRRPRAGARRRAAAATSRPAGIELRDGRPARSARRWPRRPRGVDVVYHIAAIYRQAGLPDDDLPRGQRRRPCGAIVEAAAARRRRARVVHCSTVGVHGDVEHPPANEDAPLGRATSTRTPSSKASGSRARPAAAHGHRASTIVAADRHLRPRRSPAAEAVSRRRAAPLRRSSAAAKSITISPTSTISSKASGSAGEHAGGRQPHLHPRRREVTTLNELVALDRGGRRRAAAVAAPAGLAVLDRGRGVRGGVRAVRASSRRSIAVASTSSRRAARSTSRARGRKSATRRRVGLREGIRGRWTGTVEHGWL